MENEEKVIPEIIPEEVTPEVSSEDSVDTEEEILDEVDDVMAVPFDGETEEEAEKRMADIKEMESEGAEFAG
jgi:hypothetical protein